MSGLAAQPGSSYALAILPPLVLWGLGIGIAVTPLTAAVLAAVSDAGPRRGLAINDAAARVGGVVMIALVPALIGVGVAGTLADALPRGYQPAMYVLAAMAAVSGIIAAVFVTNQRAAPAPSPTAPVAEPATP